MSANATENGGRVVGTLISPERVKRAEKLMRLGFVHVTGLPTFKEVDFQMYFRELGRRDVLKNKGDIPMEAEDPDRPEAPVIQARYNQCGYHGYNNGKTVIITEEGEVWLKAGGGYSDAMGLNPFKEFCPKGGGAWVPCSNGQEVPMHLLMERFADPYADCNKNHSPIPVLHV